MKKSSFHISLSLLSGLFIMLIASLAAANLWMLVKLYVNTSRSSATLSVLQHGLVITRHLAKEPLLIKPVVGPKESDQFMRAVDSLQHLENGLGYVTVTDNDVVIFHKQSLSTTGKTSDEEFGSVIDKSRVIVGRKKIDTGSRIIPVITFTRTVLLANGKKRLVQVALEKNIVEREYTGTTSAIKRMFVASIMTIVVSFGICLIVIIGLVQREMKWQKHRGENEHLAFAGTMASSIIHDFRNPMSAMRLDAQLLQNEAKNVNDIRKNRMIELAERINKTIVRIDELLNEFLLLSKPDSGRQERFDINSCVLDCLELLKLRFDKAGIHIVTLLSKSPVSVIGFPVQFKRALLNILNNAEQFSQAGSRVTVTTFTERNDAIVEIMDNGPGIPRAERKYIFDMFFSKRPDGTGIGLALAKTAIENCNGTIEVRPGANGKGTRFIIKISSEDVTAQKSAVRSQ